MSEQSKNTGLSVVFSSDLEAYAEGSISLEEVHCVLCESVPCVCPGFGTEAYFSLIDKAHGR